MFVGDAAVSAVSISEVVAKLTEVGGSDVAVRAALAALGFEAVSFDEPLAFEAGLLRSRTRHLGLSLGDRACLATAISLNLPAVTADRLWSELSLPIEVVLIR